MQRLHMRPLRGKHCAASARRRSCADSRLLLLAELLEARIVPKRIEHRIEPEERRSERHACGHAAIAWYRKYFLQSGDGAVGFPQACRYPGQDVDRLRTICCVFVDGMQSDGAFDEREGSGFVTKAHRDQCKIIQKRPVIWL